MPTPRKPPRMRPDVIEPVLVGGVERRELVVEDYDPAWPAAYSAHHRRISGAVGEHAVAVEHVGSTSVPGLVAKPIIGPGVPTTDSCLVGECR